MSKKTTKSRLFGKYFTKQEQKRFVTYLMVAIVVIEIALTLGAVLYSIVSAGRSPSGAPQINFPWMGYGISVVLAPVIVLLILYIINLGFSRIIDGEEQEISEFSKYVPEGRLGTLYGLVSGAPLILIFIALILIGAMLYYLDGVLSLFINLGKDFQYVLIWIVVSFAAVVTISAVVRMILLYKAKKMEEDYAFRREIFEKTGMIVLDRRQVKHTELLNLPQYMGGDVQAQKAQYMIVEASASPAEESTTKNKPKNETSSADNFSDEATIESNPITVDAEIKKEVEAKPKRVRRKTTTKKEEKD